MEKVLSAIIGTGGLSWLSILQSRKVDKTACDATHKGVCEKLDLLLQRQADYGADINYIRQRLDHHIDSGP